MRVLIGGVGYRDLRDYSFGVVVTEALAARTWPSSVAVEDVSYNPIAFVQRLGDDTPAERFGMAIVVGAARRAGRDPGTLAIYRWDNALPGPEHIQAAVAEAVTGVISLDNTLVVSRYFRALPEHVVVVEVEPEAHEFGDAFSASVRRAFDRACDAVPSLALDPSAVLRMEPAPLGGVLLAAGATWSSGSHG